MPTPVGLLNRRMVCHSHRLSFHIESGALLTPEVGVN